MRRAVLLLLLADLGCFSPRVADCAFVCGSAGAVCPPDMSCGADRFCHRAGEPATCRVGAIDASLAFDAAPLPDAPFTGSDGPVADAVRFDARRFDAAPPPDAAGAADAAKPIDAGSSPDALSCGPVCADDRTCGSTSGCECGICGDALWCTDYCLFAVCEASRCCLPESVPCDVGAGQCCNGLTCLAVCVTL